MKKAKWFHIFLALAMLVTLLAGCNSSAKDKDELQPKKEDAGDHFSVTINGTVITMDEEAQPILDALGKPNNMTESYGCGTADKMRTYDYGSFVLDTYLADGGYRIYGMWFKNDTVSTAEGIHIGSTTQEVKDAYGNVEDTSCGGYSYATCIVRKGEEQLYIFLQDDRVDSIQYMIGGAASGC